MDNLKLLQLKYVELTGSYENFPELIMLSWHGCPLQTMPSGLLMGSLVAIDMSHGHIEKFEPPTVLNSLKILTLKGCNILGSICNLDRLPKLMALVLWNCSNLTHLCKSIGELQSLETLDLKGCTKLWNNVNQLETSIISEESLLSLPHSLKQLDLASCNLEFNNDVCVPYHARSPFDLYLGVNPFEYLPNNIDFKMIRRLCLYSCPNLKSLPCLPSTLVMLYIDWCTSLESVTFQSYRFTLQEFGYECCFKLSEIQGLFKLVPIAKIDRAELGHMQWIKRYEDQKVDLVGDEITEGRVWNIQMLYEYGIKSTYLNRIKYLSLPAYEYTSSSDFLSFHVPSNFNHGKNRRIQGLSVGCIYKSLESKDVDIQFLFTKVSNITKGKSWIYNPVVYCKPTVDENVVWLSYWPIGNILDTGNEVYVHIIVNEEVIICGCGASLEYMDGKVNLENEMIFEEEVIGGDLSEFEVATQCYYLCRRDLFGSETSNGLKWLFHDNVHYPDSQGWRKTHQLEEHMSLRKYVNTLLKTIELGVRFNSESEMNKIEKAVSSLVGVESVSAHKETGRLVVTGHVDPIDVATCVREFKLTVEILSVNSTLD